jgi:hypothetical protein
LLGEGGRVEPKGGRLAKRKGANGMCNEISSRKESGTSHLLKKLQEKKRRA